MKKIIYRTNEFYKREKCPEYSNIENEYKLDEKKQELVKVGTVDLQEQIQSYEDCSLDRILDKFLKGDATALSQLRQVPREGTFERMNMDLADLAEEYERVEGLKEKYHLDDSLSYDEVLNVLKDRHDKLNDRIIKLQQLEKEKEENGKKEIKQES